ncbi:hypothetical protein A258_05938, partial [Pseudomonas syringae pv. actinidiae ICMP 19104]
LRSSQSPTDIAKPLCDALYYRSAPDTQDRTQSVQNSTDDAECDVSDRAKSDLVSKLTTEIYAPLPVATQAQLSGLSRRRV